MPVADTLRYRPRNSGWAVPTRVKTATPWGGKAMRRRHKLSDASSVFLLTCVTLIPTQARAASCENLTKLNLPDVTITSSTNMPAGRFTPPGSSSSIETHGFCRVIAVAEPTSDSVINFEAWIPSATDGNRNFDSTLELVLELDLVCLI